METYGYIPDIDPNNKEQMKELEKLNLYNQICVNLGYLEVKDIIIDYLKNNLNLDLNILDCTLVFDIVKYPETVASYWELLDVMIYQNEESLEEMNYITEIMNKHFGKNAMYEIFDGEYQLSSKKVLRTIFENAYPKPTNPGYALTISYDNIDDFIASPVSRYKL